MTRFGFKELDEDTWLEPDFISHAFVRMGPDGEPIRMEAQDWLRLILAPKLIPSVPEDVQALFEVGRAAMLYGWFFYPLYTLSTEQLFRVGEAAVDHRCQSAPKAIIKGSFSQRLKWLASKDLIPVNQLSKWEALRDLRNAASHPQRQQIMTPGNAVGLLEGISDSINGLFSGA